MDPIPIPWLAGFVGGGALVAGVMVWSSVRTGRIHARLDDLVADLAAVVARMAKTEGERAGLDAAAREAARGVIESCQRDRDESHERIVQAAAAYADASVAAHRDGCAAYSLKAR